MTASLATQSPAEAASAGLTANMRVPEAARLFHDVPAITEDMTARPRAEESSPAFLRRLLDSATPEEAITFAAYVLRPRHAVWWAHECLKAIDPVLDGSDRHLLSLVAAWATDPTESARLAALAAGTEAAVRGPGVWAALAAGWSGGSVAPPDQPEVLAPLFLTCRGVNAAVLAALARVPLDQRRRRLGHFVSMAEILARGA